MTNQLRVTTTSRKAIGAFRQTFPEVTLAKLLDDFPPLPIACLDRVVEVLGDLRLPSC